MKKRYKRMKDRRGRKNRRGKQGQIMGMPFQFIFTLILIAVAVFVAFWAIKHFMNIAEQGKIGTFVQDVKKEVNGIWSEEEAEMTPTLKFSAKFKWVCFVNITDSNCDSNIYKNLGGTEKDLFIEEYLAGYNFCDAIDYWSGDYQSSEEDIDNLFLLPLGMADKYHLDSAWKIEHIHLTKNPVCYEVVKGKVTMNFTKGEEYECDAPKGKVCINPYSAVP